MENKIEAKLLRLIGEFKGLLLTNAKLVEKSFKDKKILTLELIFSDSGLWKTMVLILNKDLTESDYLKFYESLIK